VGGRGEIKEKGAEAENRNKNPSDTTLKQT